MKARGWTCQRVIKGVRCSALNVPRTRKCGKCGSAKPAKRIPAHRRILGEMGYDEWAARFGDRCNICLREPTATRRLDRDHSHVSGVARGLLCARCNRVLHAWMTPEWLRSAAAYLERVA